jgi:hypothetical protein
MKMNAKVLPSVLLTPFARTNLDLSNVFAKQVTTVTEENAKVPCTQTHSYCAKQEMIQSK